MDFLNDEHNYENVVSSFNHIRHFKEINNNDFEKTLEDTGYSRRDQKFKALIKIAFDNLDNEIEAKLKMKEFLNDFGLKKIKIQCCFLTDLAHDMFVKDEQAIEYKQLIEELILQRTENVNTNGEIKTYDLVPIENRTDELGSWKFDPLAGHLKLYAKMQNDECFPKRWKLDRNTEIVLIAKDSNLEQMNSSLKTDMSIESFLEAALEGQTYNSNAVLKALYDLNIQTVGNLKQLKDEGWRALENKIPAFCTSLKNEIDKLCNLTKSNIKGRTEAEELGDLHKLKLFLYYNTRPEKYKQFGLLDKKALDMGFLELKRDKSFNIGPKCDEIKNSLMVYTTPQTNDDIVKRSHGMLLHGPPGTGKTQLTSLIIRKAGLAHVVEPLSSTELNRSLVGATEKLLMDIFRRATYCPHLLCYVAIDEVDALAPKRNDKAAGHKVDALSLLLSLIGGIKDIPNVFVIASTNRLNKIDDAFLRRLQDKFYIGKLNNKQRIDLLRQLERFLPGHFQIDFQDEKICDLMTQLTINFSGAALAAFRTHLFIYSKFNERTNKSIQESLIELASKVAKDFQINLGRFNVPELMKDLLVSSNNWDIEDEILDSFSQRVFIDLRDDSAIMGFEQKNSLFELDLNKITHVKFVSDLIPIILSFCIKFKIDNIQLLDNDTLLNASAFDENSINELFNDFLEEFNLNDNSMLVIDVDTLVGVVENSSESMTESKSYSLQNQRLWQNILHTCNRSYNNTSGGQKGKWIVIISSARFIIKQFKNFTKFPLSQKEKQEEEEDGKKKISICECTRCGVSYHESENGINSCTYHPLPLIEINKKTNSVSYTKNGLIRYVSNKDGWKNQEAVEDFYKKFAYKCCFRSYQESGCKNNYHTCDDYQHD